MANTIWQQFLTIIKEEVGSRVVETWFKAVSLHQWDMLNKTVYLRVPNAFVRDWIKSNYTDLVSLHLGRLLNVEKPRVVYLCGSEAPIVPVKSVSHVSQSSTIVAQTGASLVRATDVRHGSTLNERYTFETFVIGPSNSLAHAAAQAVADKPGLLYNPLLMYGDSGLGKTHLLHAIGNRIKEHSPQLRVLYQTADRFVTEFINAIRFNKVHKFQVKYQKIDVLLIDDIQFISNKEQTQEAFFHIFNALHDARKQIVFSSDLYPHDIQGLAERLRSRLAWGLVADITTPRLETKIAILKRKAELNNVTISDDVVHFIASLVDSNIRELEGALIRVVAFASLTHDTISLELAHKVLLRTHEKEPESINFSKIVKCVQKHYSYDFNALRSKGRNKELSFARQLTMFLMKKMTNKSLREIGTYVGGRDHSTVVHAVSKMEQYIQSNPSFSEKLHKMETEILR